MANNITPLSVVLSADSSGMAQGLKEAQQRVETFKGQMGSTLKSIATQSASIGLGILGAQSISQAISYGIKIAEENDRAADSFKILLGSMEKAKKMIKDIDDFADKTGMGKTLARSAGSQLVRFGFDKADVEPMLKVFGDVGATSMEGMNASMMKNIQLFGVIRDQGTFTAKNMKAFAEQGIEPWDALSKRLGKTKDELRGLLETGGIDAATGLLAVLDAMQDKFGGGMAENFNDLSTRLEKIKEGTGSILGDLTEIALNLGVTEGLAKTADFFKELRENAQSGEGVQDLLNKVGFLTMTMMRGSDAAHQWADAQRQLAAASREAAAGAEEQAQAERIKTAELKLAQEQADMVFKNAKKLQDQMRSQLAGFGVSETDAKINALKEQGIEDWQLESLQFLQKEIEAQKEKKALIEATAQAQKRFNDQVKGIQEGMQNQYEQLRFGEFEASIMRLRRQGDLTPEQESHIRSAQERIEAQKEENLLADEHLAILDDVEEAKKSQGHAGPMFAGAAVAGSQEAYTAIVRAQGALEGQGVQLQHLKESQKQSEVQTKNLPVIGAELANLVKAIQELQKITVMSY